MIYEGVKGLLLAVLKAPSEPPTPPAGSPGSEKTFRASKNLLRFNLVTGLFGLSGALLGELIGLAVTLAAGNVTAAVGLGIALVPTFLLLMFSYFMIRLDYDLRYYVITDRSLRIRHGWFILQESTYTYANVQNLKIHQGPVDRLLGIANLEIQTAGGAMVMPNAQQPGMMQHHGMLVGIENAEQVRDLILALLKKYRDAGLGDTDDARRAALAAAKPAGPAGSLSPDAMARLREVLDEARALKASVS
jgi:membrane protein YdbS with pleckstrin-like domain